MRYKFFALVLVTFALTSFDLTEAQQPAKVPRIPASVLLRADKVIK